MTVINKMENYTYTSEVFGAVFGSSPFEAMDEFNEYVQEHPDYEFVSMCPFGEELVFVVFRYKITKGKEN